MNLLHLCIVLFGLVLTLIPSAFSRKCYVCDTRAGQLGCGDAYQISQLYADCSTQYAQPGVNPQFGGGGDRCMKVTIVAPQGPPQIIRQCGSGMGAVGYVGSDGCSWNGNIQTCVCDRNYCNGSFKLPTSSLLTALVIFAGFCLARSTFT